MEVRKMHDNDCKKVFAWSEWTDDLKDEARGYLEEGYWVHFGSTALGHGMRHALEADGLRWAKEEYVGILRVAEREGYGQVYCQLI